MITFKSKGDFSRTNKFLNFITQARLYASADVYAKRGVEALKQATPKDTGKTAESWNYTISRKPGKVTITWTNSNLDENGTPIAILLQYGHAMKDGYYFQGQDYINPAIRPIFDAITDSIWNEVTKA